MTFRVPKFADWDLDDNRLVTMQLKLGNADVGTALTGRRPLAETWFDQRITLPAGYTDKAGEHRVWILLTVSFNEGESEDFVFNVDILPPSLTAQTVVPDRIKSEGITAEYFDDIPHVLLSYPGNYGDAKIDDVIEFMLAEYNASGDVDFDTERVIGRAVLLTPSTPLQTTNLTKAFLELGDDEGKRAIFVYATDRKGNKSLACPPVEVDVSLIPAPKNQAVTVALHDDDDLILLTDAQEPVSAEFNYDNFQEGDEIRVWVGEELLGDIPVNSVPFDLELTYRQLFNEDLGPKTIDLEWQVRRNNKFYPRDRREKKPLNIDLRKPGMPVDPDKPGTPGSPDPRLQPVTVFGVNRLEPNRLGILDLQEGATVFVRIHEGHKAGDRIQIRYMGVDILEDEGGVVTLVGGETEETVFKLKIPGEILREAGNQPDGFVDYWISHEGVNETIAVAPRQRVVSYMAPGVMVKPDFGKYDVGDDGPELHCGSLVVNPDTARKAVEVKFSGDTRLQDVDVKFYVQGYENAKEDGTDKNIPGDIILDAAAMVEKTPNEDEASTGFSVFFPWEVFDKIRDGWCTLHCSAKLDGYTTPSDPKQFRVGMFNPGNGDFCDLIQ